MTAATAEDWRTIDVSGLAPNTCHYAAFEKRSIIVVRDEDGMLYAYDGMCSHALLPLDGARIRRGTIMCPHHGARFDCATGGALGPPASAGLTALELKEDGNRVQVLIS